jgi:hypothetical protein
VSVPVSVPVELLDKASGDAGEPITGIAAGEALAHAKAPERPVPFLPPLRSTETSVAAMMVVQSPPMSSYVVSRAADKPGSAPSAAGHATSPAADASASSEVALAA